jgi:hypothetical protein
MPTYPNDKVQINVKDFLSNPTRITRQLDRLVNETGTIADYAFSQGPANQGAVIYDQITGAPNEPLRSAEIIAPGAEFPEVVDIEVEEKLARVDRFGGKQEITWQAIRRNDVSEVQRKIQLLAYLVVKRINARCVEAITTNPLINVMDLAGIDWANTSTDPIGDVLMAKSMIDDADLGYRANLALINPMDATEYWLGRKDIREQFARENPNLNPVLAADLGRVADLEWIKTNRVARGNIYVLQRNVSGSIRDEEGGIQNNSFDDQNRHVRILQAWRSIVPVITDPMSIVHVKGFRGA